MMSKCGFKVVPDANSGAKAGGGWSQRARGRDAAPSPGPSPPKAAPTRAALSFSLVNPQIIKTNDPGPAELCWVVPDEYLHAVKSVCCLAAVCLQAGIFWEPLLQPPNSLSFPLTAGIPMACSANAQSLKLCLVCVKAPVIRSPDLYCKL